MNLFPAIPNKSPQRGIRKQGNVGALKTTPMPGRFGINFRSGIQIEAMVDYQRLQSVGMNSELVIHERKDSGIMFHTWQAFLPVHSHPEQCSPFHTLLPTLKRGGSNHSAQKKRLPE